MLGLYASPAPVIGSSVMVQSSTQPQLQTSDRISFEVSNATMAAQATNGSGGEARMQTMFAVNGPATIGVSNTTTLSGPALSYLSPSTEEILKRVSARGVSLGAGSAGWEAAREHVLKNMRTSDSITATPVQMAPTAPRPRVGAKGRSDSTDSKTANSHAVSPAAATSSTTGPVQVTPIGFRGKGDKKPKGKGKGGRKAGKRKRADEDEDDSENDVSNDSDTYTPAQTTRSGRNVAKPTTYVPTIPSPLSASNKRRKMTARAPNARSVCKVCYRGHSPVANMIVFCDSCNTGYHQYCHHPPIENDVVLIPDKEWVCARCVRSRKQSATLQGSSKKSSKAQEAQPEMDLEKMHRGDHWTGTQRQAYFRSLSHQSLEALLMRVAETNPNIPLFPSTHPPSDFSKHRSAVDENESKIQDNALHDLSDDSAADENLDDDPPATYPRPGYGLARLLPPESEQLEWLVDDNTEVFSHRFPARDMRDPDDINSESEVKAKAIVQDTSTPITTATTVNAAAYNSGSGTLPGTTENLPESGKVVVTTTPASKAG